MSLGLGIFLSSLFLGTIVLFIITRERWRWKRILLGFMGFLAIFATTFYTYIVIQRMPQVQNAAWGISLNTSKSDVKFLKGEPNEKEGAVSIFDSENNEVWPYETSQAENNKWFLYLVWFRGD